MLQPGREEGSDKAEPRLSEHQLEQGDHNDQANQEDNTDGATEKLQHTDSRSLHCVNHSDSGVGRVVPNNVGAVEETLVLAAQLNPMELFPNAEPLMHAAGSGRSVWNVPGTANKQTTVGLTMKSEQIEGVAEKVAGKAQGAVGKLFGDSKLEAEGAGHEVAGQLTKTYGDALNNVSVFVKEKPIAALAIGAAVGVLISRFLRR